MNGKPKKSRGLPPRASRGRMMERQPNYDGAFANHRLLHTMGSLVGYNMQVQTKNKEMYEGIFSSMSSKFEVVLELPHTLNTADAAVISNIDGSKKKMIFSRDDIVTLKMKAVDVEFASRDTFAIDSAISSKQNGQTKGRMLEPWENDEETKDNLELEENENGWDATEMFKRNEEIYGVQTTYKPDMEGYTTPLPKRDTKEWKEHEVQAQKIAHEIEQSGTTLARAELENGQTEEERFSSVRPDTKVFQMVNNKRKPFNVKIPQRPQTGGQGPPSRYNNSPPRMSYGSQATGGMAYSHNRHEQPPRAVQQTADVVEENYKSKDDRERPIASHGEHSGSQSAAIYSEPAAAYSEPKAVAAYSDPKGAVGYQEPKDVRKRFQNDPYEQIKDMKQFGKNFSLAETSRVKSHPPPSNGPRLQQQSRPVPPPMQQADQGQSPQTSVLQSQPQEEAENIEEEEIASQEQAAPVEEKIEEKTQPTLTTKPSLGLNPEAKPFTPRSAATPPPVQIQQIAQPGHQHLLGTGAINYAQNYIPAGTYIVPPLQLNTQRGIRNRNQQILGGHPRTDFSSPLQVANATGTPLLSQGPIANIPAMQLSQGIMQPNQYSHYPMLVRYPGHPMPGTVLTTMLPNSYPQEMNPGPHMHGQQMFMNQAVMHHPAAPLAAQHPPQAHTPQNHNAAALQSHNMQPTQPPTPGPSPSQSGIYGGPVSGMGGQATIAAHMPPHAAHPSQSPHNSQFGGHGTVAAHPQALLMFPHQMQSQHMPQSAHSAAGQIPVSVPQYSSNSVVHFNHGPPVNYMPGSHGQAGLPLVHHNP